MRRLFWLGVLIAAAAAPVGTASTRGPAFTQAGAPAPIEYRVSFPAPEHHWMQVEVTFTGLGTQPIDARMSRSSPGRYAVSEFAKNVFSVEAFNSKGQKLAYTRPDADIWRVAGHDGTVKVVYKIFGDYANGTYMGIDTTHAHLNMPAAFMWAPGHESQAMRFTFVPPTGLNWKVGTQLFPTSDPNVFTAPNLQYMMDSPTELSDFVVSKFTVPNTDGTMANFRIVAHSDGAQADVDELATMVQRMVREHMAVYGEFPKYEPGNYTFLLDYVNWGAGDGMEHRNSTSISNPGTSLKTPAGRQGALGTISHEYFHNWNVERIRPVGLEPFDFTRENVTCCLWVAEGFTQYYGPLLLTRAGLSGGGRGGGAPVGGATAVINTPGRAVRSPVQMSEYAPFADGAGTFVDATDGSRTFLSYYTYGSGIALALDLSIRELSGGKQSLDDFMRLMWTEHGKPGGPAPGLVGKPYSVKDLRDKLATLTGNRKFADDFFDKYVEGRDAPDYAHLLSLAGYVLRGAEPGKGWIGGVAVAEATGGIAIGGGGGGRGGGARLVPFDTPVYDAGIDAGDTITTIDGQPATVAGWNAMANKKPGDQVSVVVMRRGGATVTKTITVKQDPTAQSVTPIESTPGGALTDAQKAFREAWLSTRVH